MVAIGEILDSSALDGICRAYRVQRLRVFGSVARGEPTPDSDADLLVDFENGYTPSLFRLVELSERLRPVFGGRKVDLAVPADLHWFIRDQVLASARTVYER
jgi:uncharacterized protein